MNWISFVLEIYCHKLDVIQHFKSIWRSRLFFKTSKYYPALLKKSHLEERFLNSAKRANLPLKSLNKGTGDKIHFGRRYFIDCYSREFFSNASLLTPETLLLQVFFPDFLLTLSKDSMQFIVQICTPKEQGVEEGEFWIETNIALLVEMWGLPSIPTQILDICDCLFLLHYF